MRILTLLILGAFFLLVYMALLASSDPVVRYLRCVPKDWPAAAPPRRLVLLSDTHVSGPDTPPARLAARRYGLGLQRQGRHDGGQNLDLLAIVHIIQTLARGLLGTGNDLRRG